MKYLLLIYQDEQAFSSLSEEDRQAIYLEYRQLREELSSNGKFLSGSQLLPSARASRVKVRNGKALTVDGPFAETKEQLGGFFLVEVEDASEAHSIAARIPSARAGTIEVRALV